ncbi:hypothetical protein [Candidatus Foliamicus sp.]
MTTGRWSGLVILLALLGEARSQEVWRHMDGEGRVRYADRPFAGAVRLQAPAVPRWLGASVADAELPAAQDASASQPVASRPLPALEVAYPADGDTVWGAGGELEVRLIVTGAVEDDVRISIRLDGAEVSWQGEPPVLQLNEVWRGERRLQARLLDAQGRELAASEEVRFFKREPAISSTLGN